MVNVYNRTITFEDPPTVQQSLADFVVAVDYGDAEGAALTLPGGATNAQIVNIARVQLDATVTAAAIADLTP